MPFVIRCNGGPTPGARFCARLEDYGLTWPLPDALNVPGSNGVYRKVSESQLPPEAAEDPHVGVGAEYEWEETLWSDSAAIDLDDARLERIQRVYNFVPLSLYDEVQKLSEIAVGEFIAERDLWKERTQHLLRTDPSEWEPEVVRWLKD